MSMLRMSRLVVEEMRSHGEESYPHECCGVLLGTPLPEGWEIECSVRARNARTDAPQNRYEIAPAELVRILRDARKLGLEIAGFYHSHPDHPAMWSQTDLAEAHWIGCCYVITEVAEGHALTMNAFLLAGSREEDKSLVPISIEMI